MRQRDRETERQTYRDRVTERQRGQDSTVNATRVKAAAQGSSPHNRAPPQPSGPPRVPLECHSNAIRIPL
eukprot:3066715-Heterocapsa_arctica.AAC.1